MSANTDSKHAKKKKILDDKIKTKCLVKSEILGSNREIRTLNWALEDFFLSK